MRRGRAIDGQGMLENERAQLCKAHALSCGACTRKKARFIYFLLYHPRTRLRARARFHPLLSSYTSTQEQHSGPSCAISSGLRPAHFSSHFAATISAPPQRIFTRFAREFSHSRRCRCRPRFRARAPDRSRRPAPAWASRARREHPRPGQVRGHTLEAAHEAGRVAHTSSGVSPSPGKLADRSACHGAAGSALRSTATPRRSQRGRWRTSLGPSAELRARGVHFDRW